jgi:NTP pyrophosphatase (non-canonical NTP hydrolase)|tara:strand:+ start:637 stop:966 length:330 start_codon:yes stop_codon:yes gene_type:complete
MINEEEYIKHAIQQVVSWHLARNLIHGSSDKDQVLKLIQEVGELSDSICKEQSPIDDIGDIMVVLINIIVRNNLSVTECLNHAYNDIKDRKGKMIDGIFVKEEDMNGNK